MIEKEKAMPDIQIVKHSKWEINSDGYYPFCLSCGSATDKLTKYCPNCGAKMDGDKND